MVQAGKEDPQLNLLVGPPERRVGRRSFLQAAGLLAAAGVAGYAGGTVAGMGDDDLPAATASGDGAPISGNRRNERLLNIYNWSDYIDDRTIPLFQAQGRPPPRQRRPLHELRAPSQGAVRISRYVSYGTPVSLAKPLLPAEQTSDPSIYPPASTKLSIVTLTGQKLERWQATYDQIVR